MLKQDEPLGFQPPRIYVLKQVWDKPSAAARAERVIAACNGAEVRTFTYNDLPDIVEEEGWDHFPRMGRLSEAPPPIPLLGLFEFDREKAAAAARRMKEAYKGTGNFAWHDAAGGRPFYFSSGADNDGGCRTMSGIRPDPQWVCRPQWRLQQGRGCPHQCAYCHLGGVLVSHVNTEEYIEHLAKLLKQNPWQKAWLYDDNMDVPTLEPQLDTLGPLMRFFESTGDRYLIVHTKTDRVQGFLRANAPKNTIITWSLSGSTQSRKIEPKSGSTEGRIEAARRCQETGITVRFKFKPIVPVPDWREEASYMIDHMFSKTRPDNLSMTVLMWMDAHQMKACIRTDLLDREFLRAAEEAAEELGDDRNGPFPMVAREDIYRHYMKEVRARDKEVPLTISTESLKMWKRLGPDLGFTPADYVCGCGGTSTPGKQRLETNPYHEARSARTWDGQPPLSEKTAD